MGAVVADLAGKDKLEVRIFVEQTIYGARRKLHDEKIVGRAPDIKIDQGIPLFGRGGVTRRAGSFQWNVRGILLDHAIEHGFFKRACVAVWN